jgi:hypothetical protein
MQPDLADNHCHGRPAMNAQLLIKFLSPKPVARCIPKRGDATQRARGGGRCSATGMQRACNGLRNGLGNAPTPERSATWMSSFPTLAGKGRAATASTRARCRAATAATGSEYPHAGFRNLRDRGAQKRTHPTACRVAHQNPENFNCGVSVCARQRRARPEGTGFPFSGLRYPVTRTAATRRFFLAA